MAGKKFHCLFVLIDADRNLRVEHVLGWDGIDAEGLSHAILNSDNSGVVFSRILATMNMDVVAEFSMLAWGIIYGGRGIYLFGDQNHVLHRWFIMKQFITCRFDSLLDFVHDCLLFS
ncbi:hypothetical protein ACFE04_012419 [Oxalis oulophora]